MSILHERLGLAFMIALAGCGGSSGASDRGTGEMDDQEVQLRALHSKFLDRQPIVADLPEELRGVANACRVDEEHALCKYGRENLSDQDWDRIRAAWAEDDRRAADQAEVLAACQRGDEAALRSMYAGHAAFYEMVLSPPEFVEEPVDAVVAIGISSRPRGRAQDVVERGMAVEGLSVQYGGPRLEDYSPNKYAGRLNTERFFRGYYTPEIEERMVASRPECDRLRNTPFIQAACRRDIAVSVVRDWMEARGHQSVRFIVSGQSSWPEYQLLLDRLLPEMDASIDTGSFHSELRRDSSFLREICAMGAGPELWLDYEFYVTRLFPKG